MRPARSSDDFRHGQTGPAPAGYSGTPLPKKLGMKPGATVALVGAPADFEKTLGALPEGACLRAGLRGEADLIVAFVRSRAELRKQLPALARRCGAGAGLWLAWPKKSSGVATDLSEDAVRAAGLAAGLVDFKVCAIDATWSGHRFAPRRG